MPILVSYDPAGLIAGAALQSGYRDRFLEDQALALRKASQANADRRTDIAERRFELDERSYEQQREDIEALRAQQEEARRAAAELSVPQSALSNVPIIGSLFNARQQGQIDRLSQLDPLDQQRVLRERRMQEQAATQEQQAAQTQRVLVQTLKDAAEAGIVPEEMLPGLVLRAAQGDMKLFGEIKGAYKEAAEAQQREDLAQQLGQLLISTGTPPEQAALIQSAVRSGAMTMGQGLNQAPDSQQASPEALAALEQGDVKGFTRAQLASGETVPTSLQERSFPRQETTKVSVNINKQPESIVVPKGGGQPLVWDPNNEIVRVFRHWAAQSIDKNEFSRNKKTQEEIDRQAKIIATSAGWDIQSTEDVRKRALEQSRKVVEPMIQQLADRLVDEASGSLNGTAQAQSQAPAGAPRAVNQQTGQTVVFINGQWVPEQ